MAVDERAEDEEEVGREEEAEMEEGSSMGKNLAATTLLQSYEVEKRVSVFSRLAEASSSPPKSIESRGRESRRKR